MFLITLLATATFFSTSISSYEPVGTEGVTFGETTINKKAGNETATQYLARYARAVSRILPGEESEKIVDQTIHYLVMGVNFNKNSGKSEIASLIDSIRKVSPHFHRVTSAVYEKKFEEKARIYNYGEDTDIYKASDNTLKLYDHVKIIKKIIKEEEEKKKKRIESIKKKKRMENIKKASDNKGNKNVKEKHKMNNDNPPELDKFEAYMKKKKQEKKQENNKVNNNESLQDQIKKRKKLKKPKTGKKTNNNGSFLDEIKEGITLKSREESEKTNEKYVNKNNSEKKTLMDEIKEGIQLRKTEEIEKKPEDTRSDLQKKLDEKFEGTNNEEDSDSEEDDIDSDW